MTEELQKTLTEIFIDTKEMIGKGVEMTKDYLVDAFDRYTTYLIIIDAIYLLVGLLAMAFAGIILRNTYRDFQKSEDKDAYIINLSAIVAIPIFIIMLFVNLFTLDDLVKDIFIPEVRVLESIKEEAK